MRCYSSHGTKKYLRRVLAIIKRKNEMSVTTHPEFLNGKGVLKNVHFLAKEDAAGAGRLFTRSILTPGSSIGYHTHKGDFEVYYILKGTALVNDNGQEHTLQAGDAIHTPNGSSHSIENIGDTDLEYIAMIIFDRQDG